MEHRLFAAAHPAAIHRPAALELLLRGRGCAARSRGLSEAVRTTTRELADIASDWLFDIEQLRDVGVRGFMHEMDEVARKAEHPGLYGDDPDAEPPAEETDE